MCKVREASNAGWKDDIWLYQSMRHRQKASNAACQLLTKSSDWDGAAALRLDRRLKLVRPVLATCRVALLL